MNEKTTAKLSDLLMTQSEGRPPAGHGDILANTSEHAFQPPTLKSFLGPPPTARPTNEVLYQIVTRCVDVVVAVTGLLVTLPIMLPIGLAILRASPGPALFKHTRVGLNRRRQLQTARVPERRRENRFGKPFQLYKFRTMYTDARERYPARYAYEYTEEQLCVLPMKVLLGCESGTGYGMTDEQLGSDPRLTQVGRRLRRTSLDELPNLINVLLGDLSLVGGRPELLNCVWFYRPGHLRKFDMKPGVTGLAQVLGRGNLPFHQINAYDAEYVEHHSLRLYFWILFRTIRVVFKGEGAF